MRFNPRYGHGDPFHRGISQRSQPTRPPTWRERVAGAREAAKRDAAEREAAGRERQAQIAARHASAREVEMREAAAREAAAREAAARETAARETAARETAAREAAEREAAEREAAEREAAEREAEQAALAHEAAEAQRRNNDSIERITERLTRERDREIDRRERQLFVGMLDLIDDLDRTLAAATTGSEADTQLLQGVSMVRDRFLTKLSAEGVTEHGCAGDAFDPQRHEALAIADVDESESGRIQTVVTRGFERGGELIRPAGVVVGQCASV